MKAFKKLFLVLTLAVAAVTLSACSLNSSYKLDKDVTIKEESTTANAQTTISQAETATDDAKGFTMKAVINDGDSNYTVTYKYDGSKTPALASIEIKGNKTSGTIIFGSEYVFFNGNFNAQDTSATSKYKISRLLSSFITLDVSGVLKFISSAAGNYDQYLTGTYADKVVTAGKDKKGNFVFDYDENKLDAGTVSTPAHARYVVVDGLLSYVAVSKGTFSFYYELTMKTPSISEPNPDSYSNSQN